MGFSPFFNCHFDNLIPRNNDALCMNHSIYLAIQKSKRKRHSNLDFLSWIPNGCYLFLLSNIHYKARNSVHIGCRK